MSSEHSKPIASLRKDGRGEPLRQVPASAPGAAPQVLREVPIAERRALSAERRESEARGS